MNLLEKQLSKLNPAFYSNLEQVKDKVKHLLQKYSANFPTYTDHSIEHTQEVMNIAANLLNENELNNLNEDELYVLSMACILHDVGMCIPEEKIQEISDTDEIANYRKLNADVPVEIFIRDIHHVLSRKFILEEWKDLGIPSEKYAQAISLVAQGHRKVDLSDFEVYEPKYYVKNGRDFVCLPYLSCLIRIADELDISNQRTPDMLCKYYLPDNEISQREWNKHKSTIQINFSDDEVIIEAKCSDHNMLGALEEQFNKIQDVLTNCQKIIRSLYNIGQRELSLEIARLSIRYKYIDFDPKGIKYSFDVKNVINAFVGKDLYNNDDAALREALQNAIDACNYKKAIQKTEYQPIVSVTLEKGEIIIEDNGQGMDEFVIENYFGRLASSFYNQQEVKAEFQAIGQFGIGVFSYFLISDYIDVETKRLGKSGLKFRTDQDPNGYFHFFENFEKVDEGTKLILHLKDEFISKIDFTYIEKFLRKNFPFIDIPIHLNEGSYNIVIKRQSHILDLEEHVTPKMFFSHHESKSDIILLTSKISNKDFEGTLGMIIPSTSNFRKTNLRGFFDSNSFSAERNNTHLSKIEISQKGVYVNSYGCYWCLTVGKINIHKKLNISLNRTSFRKVTDVLQIIDVFLSELVKKVFIEYLPSIGITSDEEVTEFSAWLIDTYFTHVYLNYNAELINLFNQFFRFSINDRGNQRFLTLSEIKDKYHEIYIKAEKEETDFDFGSVVSIDFFESKWIYNNFFTTMLNYGSCVDEINNEYVTVLRKESYSEITSGKSKTYDIIEHYSEYTIVNNKKIAVDPFRNIKEKLEDYINMYHIKLNLRHPIINKIINDSEALRKDESSKKVVQEIIKIIYDYYNSITRDLDSSIKNLNILIDKLNPSMGLPYFSKDDF